MQIKINLKILFFIILFFLTKKLEIYFIFLFFAICHELGHLFIGILLGFKPDSICLKPVGLSLSFKIKTDAYNKRILNGNIVTLKKIIVILAGPVINFLFAFVFYKYNIIFYGIDRELIVYANILIGMFNLLPIYPLDGGRIIKNAIHLFKGLQQSYKYSYVISNIFIVFFTVISSFLILYIKNMYVIFIITYLWIITINENKNYKEKQLIYKAINKYIEN